MKPSGGHMHQPDTPAPAEYPLLLDLWEASVRATHHFLRPGDIDVFRQLIREHQVLEKADLSCIRDGAGTIRGFMGTAAGKLEMLFVSPACMGQGIGKALLLHVIRQLHVRSVDVNEQNAAALRFYERHGFRVTGRSELDGTGKP